MILIAANTHLTPRHCILQLVRAVPSFNPVCASTYAFDEELDIDKLRDALHKQCQVFPKYRQRLTIRNKFLQPPYYEDDPDWNLDRHLEIVNLPEPAGPKELNAFVGHLSHMGLSL